MGSQTEDEQLLEFETAMRDFSNMFPTMTPEYIEDVLRKHDGDVAATVDELLVRSTPARPAASPTVSLPMPSPSSSAMPSPSYLPPPSPPPAYTPLATPQSAVPQTAMISPRPNDKYPTSRYIEATSSQRPLVRHQSADVPGTINRASRQTRLSADELLKEKAKLDKMRRMNAIKLDHVSDEKEARLLEDEQLALMMQDKEFTKTLRKEYYGSNHSHTYAQSPRYERPIARRMISSPKENARVPEGPVIDEIVINQSEADIKEKLRNMSKASKAKLLQIASKFRRQEQNATLYAQ